MLKVTPGGGKVDGTVGSWGQREFSGLSCSEHSLSEAAEKFWAEVFRLAGTLHSVSEVIVTK